MKRMELGKTFRRERVSLARSRASSDRAELASGRFRLDSSPVYFRRGVYALALSRLIGESGMLPPIGKWNKPLHLLLSEQRGLTCRP